MHLLHLVHRGSAVWVPHEVSSVTPAGRNHYAALRLLRPQLWQKRTPSESQVAMPWSRRCQMAARRGSLLCVRLHQSTFIPTTMDANASLL